MRTRGVVAGVTARAPVRPLAAAALPLAALIGGNCWLLAGPSERPASPSPSGLACPGIGSRGPGGGTVPSFGPARSDGPWLSPLRPAVRRLQLPATEQDALPPDSERVTATVRAKCSACHVEGGMSGHTRLVFSPSSALDTARTVSVFRGFLSAVEGGADRILEKVTGASHGGGLQVAPGSAEHAILQRFLKELAGRGEPDPTPPESPLDGLTLAAPEVTLWRAALVLAGRSPTPAELQAAGEGRESSLRQAVRGLMSGPGFHDFLIRSANDRLLTDRHLRAVRDFRGETHLVDLANLRWKQAQAAIARGYQLAMDDPVFRRWEEATQLGLARAPLELIAHVVENDRPYTEILTADYTMANPMTAAAFGAPVQFSDSESPHEFRPARIRNYFRTDLTKKTEFHIRYGTRVAQAGSLRTEYPHAGVLSTISFLRRYPTSAVNRNRSRARWALYHFLGVDVGRGAELAASPTAPQGSGGPSTRSGECAGCHSVLDPVAGTFQYFDPVGGYKTAFGGMDSLPESYRSGSQAYRTGDIWYRDMDPPGIAGAVAPRHSDSLQWLARRIADDPRFAEATVRFWWPAVMGAEMVGPDASGSGPGVAGRREAFEAQTAEVAKLARSFRRGFRGGDPYNAKDLLTEIVLSPWFRADSAETDGGQVPAAAALVGAERLLTPEELSRKTESLTGYRWGRYTARGLHEVGALDGNGPDTGGSAELLYGGIDSGGIQSRARSVTPLMAAVAQGHAIHASCAIVQREFFLWPPQQRLLFRGISAETTPESPGPGDSYDASAGGRSRGAIAIRRKLVDLHWRLYGIAVGPDSPEINRAFDLFELVWERKRRTEGPEFRDGQGPCRVDDTRYFEGVLDGVVVEDEWGNTRIDWERVLADWTFEMKDPSYAVRTWMVVLAHLMSDYRYLHL